MLFNRNDMLVLCTEYSWLVSYLWRSHTNKVKTGARFSFSKRHKEKRQKEKENGNFKSKQKNGLKNRQKKEIKGDEMK